MGRTKEVTMDARGSLFTRFRGRAAGAALSQVSRASLVGTDRSQINKLEERNMKSTVVQLNITLTVTFTEERRSVCEWRDERATPEYTAGKIKRKYGKSLTSANTARKASGATSCATDIWSHAPSQSGVGQVSEASRGSESPR